MRLTIARNASSRRSLGISKAHFLFRSTLERYKGADHDDAAVAHRNGSQLTVRITNVVNELHDVSAQ